MTNQDQQGIKTEIKPSSLVATKLTNDERDKIYDSLVAEFCMLKLQIARGRIDPVNFTELYSKVVALILNAPQWAWPEIIDPINSIRAIVVQFEPKYLECLTKIEKKRQRRIETNKNLAKREHWSDPWWSLRRHILNDLPKRAKGPFKVACSACGKYYWPDEKEEHLANECNSGHSS